MDGWKTILSFLGPIFRGKLLVLGRVSPAALNFSGPFCLSIFDSRECMESSPKKVGKNRFTLEVDTVATMNKNAGFQMDDDKHLLWKRWGKPSSEKWWQRTSRVYIYIYNFFILLKFQSFILFLVPFSICIFKFQPFSGVYESVILDMLGHGAKHKSKNIPHIWHGFVQNGDESHLAM